MNRERATIRLSSCCLILSAVLVLGIIQWSFLPFLVQNGAVSGNAVFEMSAGHTSKFAAPFKYLFGDSLKPSLAQSNVSAPPITRTLTRLPDEPRPKLDDRSFTSRQLRAPPHA
jgi:hypothetical protein